MMNVHTCFADNTTYTVVWCMWDYYVRWNVECTHICYCVGSAISKTCAYIHHYIWDIGLTYTMVSGISSVTPVCMFIITSDIVIWHKPWCKDCNTIYTMVYLRSLCQILWWTHTHILLIALLTSWCMLDHYVRCNDECTQMYNW
jgi:hypothetical protein